MRTSRGQVGESGSPGWRGVVLAALILPVPVAAAGGGPAPSPAEDPYLAGGPVRVEILENLPAGEELEPGGIVPTSVHTEPAFGFVRIPTRYNERGVALDRSTPFVLRATMEVRLPAGQWQFRVRARGATRLLVDGQALLSTLPQRPNTDAADPVPPPPAQREGNLRRLPPAHQEVTVLREMDGRPHRVQLLALIGGKGLYPDPGELAVFVSPRGAIPRLLGSDRSARLLDGEWSAYVEKSRRRHDQADVERRRAASARTAAAWAERHERIREWLRRREADRGPRPVGIDAVLGTRPPARPLADFEFLRRVTLDLTGLIPTPDEIRAYRADPPDRRRSRAVDRLLASPGWADHWVSYWQDALAENPGILKPDLNNTGPFRWWLHQAFQDDIPFDRFAAELVMMEGSVTLGAPAAFGVAALNDAPMAAKAHVLSQAFLARDMACARCHDAPSQPYKQRDLFSLAALLQRRPARVPATSSVQLVAGFRTPQVPITLRPGEDVEPRWPFSDLVTDTAFPIPGFDPADSRARLAALMVAPENPRFAQVIVNRVWQRLMGRGLVEPVEDWTAARPVHPALLDYLAREFVASGYRLKHLARMIVLSSAYQRAPESPPADAGPPGPDTPLRRRMTAEQLLDSLFLATGKRFNSEELNLSPLGDRPPSQFLNLGVPCRAWQMTALSNERDRPALSLPNAQSLVDVLTAYGWRQSRQAPSIRREDAPNVSQVLTLANGPVGARIVRLSDDGALTALCLKERPVEALVNELFLRILSRPPSGREGRAIADYLRPVYANRIVTGAPFRRAGTASDRRVSWANHLSPEATLIRMSEERALRFGEPPTLRLRPQFRERAEDVIWALINSPEFATLP